MSFAWVSQDLALLEEENVTESASVYQEGTIVWEHSGRLSSFHGYFLWCGTARSPESTSEDNSFEAEDEYHRRFNRNFNKHKTPEYD